MKNVQFHAAFITRTKQIAGICLLAALALALSSVIVKMGDKTGIIVLISIIGFGWMLSSFLNTSFGFYSSIVLGFSIFILGRKFGQDLPWGGLVESQLITTFAGMFFRKALKRDRLFEGARHPITYGYILYTLFLIIELFNPSMQSLEGWTFIFRKFVDFMIIYLLALELFKDMRQIKYYFSFWIFFAFISAVYGCYHEWFGMFDFEMDWIWSTPGRAGLYSLDNGNFRKFSLFSDPAAYGIGMAVSALFTLVLAIGASKRKTTVILFVACLFMLLGMAFSGTRTAFSIIPAGVVLYILMTITRRNTLIFACFSVAAFVVIIWAPIYGNPTVNRIRSAFEASEDASMKVRDVNRHSIQPYIYRHPIGGGLATSGMQGLEYNPNHILAGFPPDSGFVRVAVETGWIGLAIQCMLYFVILVSGVKGFYDSDDKMVRLYFLGVVVALFSFMMAQYAQVSIGQIPGCFLFYPFVAILVRLQQYTNSQKIKINRP